MKKLLIASIIIIVALTGCGVNKGDDILGNRFTVKNVIKSRGFGSDIYVLIDKKSGVNYYCVATGYATSICPIYDKEGKVVIDKVEQE